MDNKSINIKIVADSSSDLLSLENVSFAAAPLKIITTQKEYTDDKELDVRGMVDDLLKYKDKSSTSCPNPEDWLLAFGDAEQIFCITITSGLSGSYNSACVAKKIYEEQHPERRVFVVDSLSTGPEMKLIVEKIEELVLSGTTYDDICNKITAYCKKTRLLFMLESMKNLANNGRVSHIAAKAAGLLGIRVVGKASDKGQLELLDKIRGEKKALEAIVGYMKSMGMKTGKVRISHCFNEDAAKNLKELILKEFSKVQIEIYNCRGLCSFYAEKGGMIIGFETV